jgi:carboxypeptidase C (cathepsin A)
MRTCRFLTLLLLLTSFVAAQQKSESKKPTDKKPTPTQKTATSETTATQPDETRAIEPQPAQGPSSPLTPPTTNTKFDVKEMPPVVTHHSIKHSSGKTLQYTATTGRMPIKDAVGNVEAEMFYVAYTLDGQDSAKRPITFAFNGGPGSSSIWLHMGTLGPRKVVLQPEGWMPQAPYRVQDNPYTPLDQTDIVMIDMIGTGYSRPLDTDTGKKFWGLRGDIESFGEFIRMYLSRNERWSSPLFLLGESYGTTRASGLAGYLVDKGISFNGITLLSTIMDFQSVLTSARNDEGYVYTLPTFTNIAFYHKKLPADLQQDFAKTRAEAEAFASGEYTVALAKGDSLSAADRKSIIEKIARYTGLKKDFIDQANLRVDVEGFSSQLLLDEKLRVGRLDGRFTAPSPVSTLNREFYDPSSAAITPPFTSVFNDYVRRELGYKVDMPYYVYIFEAPYGRSVKWDWNPGDNSGFEMGYTDTASALRAAIIKNPYMKVLVMEGFYDLATPYYAVHYTMDHLDLAPKYHQNISYADYEAGHMVYIHTPSLEKMHKDYTNFVISNVPK